MSDLNMPGDDGGVMGDEPPAPDDPKTDDDEGGRTPDISTTPAPPG